jgi:hypothetical protein
MVAKKFGLYFQQEDYYFDIREVSLLPPFHPFSPLDCHSRTGRYKTREACAEIATLDLIRR